MKVRKFVAVMLAVCLLAVSVPVTAFADVLKREESIENLTDIASPSDAAGTVEGVSFSDTEYIKGATERKAAERETNADELSDTIVLTAEASDGVMVTMKAGTEAFSAYMIADPSEDEGVGAASPSDAVKAEEFDPELLTLVAEVIEEKNEEAVDEALEDETENDYIASRKTYDIYVLYDGEKTEPAAGNKIEVSFRLPDVPSGADEVTIYHHTEEGIETIVDESIDDDIYDDVTEHVEDENTATKASGAETSEAAGSTGEKKDIDTDTAVLTVSGETGSFSFYTIDFTYNEKTVSIPGDSAGNLLADILKDVEIEGKILEAKAYQDTECKVPAENGIVKNENGDALFKIYEENGVWYADAIHSFDTEHGLYVKTENAEYKIRVTDGQYVASVTAGGVTTSYETVTAAWSAAQEAGTATVKLLADVSANLTNGSGKNIKLDLNGYVLESAGSGSVITNNGTLTIMDTANSSAGPHYFKVNSKGLWVLDSTAASAAYTFDAVNGLKKKDGSASSDIPEENSIIAVTGGCITGGNKTSNNGGGVYSKDGSLTLQAGNIVGNTGSNAGGGVYVYSYEKEASFTMTGGSIAGNIAQRDDIYPGIGGGVSCACQSAGTNFTMTGGIIAANKAPMGGGIYVSTGCKFNISGDARVSCNASSAGSAVYLSGADNSSKALFQMSGNASMSGNKGKACVYIAQYGSFTMTGGSITDNKAETSDDKFAGVCAYTPGNSVVSVGGTAVIRDNKLTDGTECNLYLNNGNVAISTETPFAAGASIGVTTATVPTATTPTVQFTASGHGQKADEAYFFSDNPNYTDKYNNSGSGYLELVVGYAVSCADCTNGSVSVGSQKSAYQGETVTVMTTPAKGYMLDAVKITKTDGGTDVTTTVGYTVDTGTFTMPDYAVTVSAIFKSAVFVCQTGSGETAVKYTSIADALKASHEGESAENPTTITLIADDKENVVIPGDDTTTAAVDETRFIIFDLNGYVLQGTGSGSVISNYGTLTIKDGSKDNAHYFKYSKSGAWTFCDDADEDAKKSAIEADAITGTTADDTLIKVYGGCITGGNSGSNHGGGIIVSAYSGLTMTGGNICGNKANQGGGLYTGSNTIVKLKDVTIAGNYASSNCGGMMFNADKNASAPDPSLTIGGKVKIIRNTSSKGNDKNFTLWMAKAPLVIDSLENGSEIGLTIRKWKDSASYIADGAFTTNGTADDVQYFTSDAAGYSVVYKPDTGTTGHLELAKACTVTLDGNEATTAGSVTSLTAVSGSAMPAITGEGSLPSRTGYTFAGYFDAQTGGNQYYNTDGTSAKDWDKTTDTATLYAQWTHVHGAWKYTASKAELTATCGNPGCTATAFAVSISINATNKSYDGNKYSNASIDNIDAWKEAGLDTPDIDYYVKGQTAKLDEAPTAAGEYTAKITAGDKTAVADFTISQKSLTVTGTTADGKTYDGTTTAVAHIGTVSGKEDGDDVTVSIRTAEFNEKDAGNGRSVTVSYDLTGTQAGNYTVADSTTSAAIAKRAITLTSGSATKAYDGKPLTKDEVEDSLTGSADEAGFVDGEGATYTVTGSQTDVGSSANTFTYTLKEGTKADNYTITKEEGVLKVLEADKCTVTFEMNGHGTQVSEQYVVLNQRISRPDDPTTADHWCFKGWYRSGMETAWDFLSDAVSEDITLYAKWIEGDHTVRFNCDEISDRCVPHNEIITLPEAQKSGYEFLGWLKNGEEAGKLYPAESSYKVTEDVSFTPSFAVKKMVVGKEIKISDTSDIDASKAGKGSNETEKLIIRQVSKAKLAGAYPVDISSSIRESTLENYLKETPSANELMFKLNVELTDVHAEIQESSTSTKLTYNVTPVFYAMENGIAVSGEQVVPNSELSEPVKFCLTMPTSALAVAEVKHMESDGMTVKDTKYYDVQTKINEDGVTEKYIEAESDSFSDFVITFIDARPAVPEPQSSDSDSAVTAGWIRDAKGWRYRFASGTYAADGWYELANPYAGENQEKTSWFHFGADTYMQTGWFTDRDGKKYYLHPVSDGTQGRMYHGKQTVDGKEYGFSEIHDGYFGHLTETDALSASSL